MRIIVGLLWVLNTAQLILVVQSIFGYTIMWKGNMAELNIVSQYVYIKDSWNDWFTDALEYSQFEVSELWYHSVVFRTN